jgi:hypothetical protein
LSDLVLEALGIITIPKEEVWLFDPANKKLVDEIKKSLKETATIDLGSFAKYADDEADEASEE